MTSQPKKRKLLADKKRKLLAAKKGLTGESVELVRAEEAAPGEVKVAVLAMPENTIARSLAVGEPGAPGRPANVSPDDGIWEALRELGATWSRIAEERRQRAQRRAEAVGAELCRAPGSGLSLLIQCLDRMIEGGWATFYTYSKYALRLASEAARERADDEFLAIALNRLKGRIHAIAPAHVKRLQENRDELVAFLLRPKDAGEGQGGAVLEGLAAVLPAQREAAEAPASGGKLTHLEIAARYGVKPEAARKRLDRWRKHNLAGWVEVSDRARGEPKYVYDPEVIAHLFAGEPSA